MSYRYAEWPKNNKCTALSAAIGLFLTCAVVTGFAQADPERAYQKEFVSSGECLADSPYDPANGARLLTDEVDGMHIVEVVPRYTDTVTPAVLVLQAIGRGPYRTPALLAVDHFTAAVLFKANCPEQPDRL